MDVILGCCLPSSDMMVYLVQVCFRSLWLFLREMGQAL